MKQCARALRLTDFGIENKTRYLPPFQAPGDFPDRARDGEIVSLSLEHDSVSSGGRYEVGPLRPDQQHFRISLTDALDS
jgi:hypothetical protein